MLFSKSRAASLLHQASYKPTARAAAWHNGRGRHSGRRVQTVGQGCAPWKQFQNCPGQRDLKSAREEYYSALKKEGPSVVCCMLQRE